MFNLMTFAETPTCDAQWREMSQNIEQDQLGREALEKLVTNKMVENTVGLGEPQKKNNICFKDVGPGVKAKISFNQRREEVAFQTIGYSQKTDQNSMWKML